jgi:hypothetical protein
MKTPILMIGFALFFLCTSCSSADVQPAYCTAKQNEEIELSLRQEIHKINDDIIEVIQQGSSEELFGYVVTGLADEQEARQKIYDAFPAMAQLLAEQELEVYQDCYCVCEGEGSTSCTLHPETDYDFQISIEAVSNEMFVSLLETQEFHNLLLSIVYVKQGDNWRLWQYSLGSIKIAERNAVQWYEEASEYYKQGYLVPAIFRLQLSSTCLHPAPFLKYQREGEIVDLIEKAEVEFNSEYSFPIQLSGIESNPVIYYIKSQFVQQEIIPVIWYVTSIELEDINGLKEEANMISPIVQEMFPGIAEGTEQIAFQAFSEPPTDPDREYDSYGTVVEVD